MTTAFVSTFAHNLQDTLEGIIDDDEDGVKSSMYRLKWAEDDTMDKAYVDFLEMGGPGLAYEKPEGTDLQVGALVEGPLYRALARTFGLRMSITEEAMEDVREKEAIRLAFRLKRAMYKTQDIDMTNVLVRGWNTSYIGGDGVCLFSASHTLPHGGTFSNTLSTALALSRSALLVMRANVRKLPGHDGVIDGNITCEKIICPVELESIAEGILQSAQNPDSDFNEKNVVRNMGLGSTPVAIPFWNNTATNWCVRTSCEGAPTFYTRRAPRSRTWINESQEVMHYGISSRWARMWTDARSMYGSQS